MLVGVISLMEHFLQNLGTSSAHVDFGQICCVLDDVSMIILIKHWKKLQYTPQRVKIVAKKVIKAESSRQIRPLACWSMTTDSQSHLVAPAVSTYYPVIQQDVHRRLSEEEQ